MPRAFLSPSRLRRQPPPRGGLTARRRRAVIVRRAAPRQSVPLPQIPPSKSQQFPTKFCAPTQNVEISPEVVNYADAKIAITGNTVNTTNILSVHGSVKDATNLGSWDGIAMNNNEYNSDAVKVVGFDGMDDNIKTHYEALVK